MLACFYHTLDCVDHVIELVEKINSGVICVGNPDQQFVNLDFSGIPESFKSFSVLLYINYSSADKTVAHRDTITLPYATIRHNQCQLLLSSDGPSCCQQCDKYRCTLRATIYGY